MPAASTVGSRHARRAGVVTSRARPERPYTRDGRMPPQEHVSSNVTRAQFR